MKTINTGSNAAVMTIRIPEKGSVYARDNRNPKLLLKLSRQRRDYVQIDEKGNDIILGGFMQIGRAQAVLKLDDKINEATPEQLTKIVADEKAALEAQSIKDAKKSVEDGEKKAKAVGKERDEKAKAAAKENAKK